MPRSRAALHYIEDLIGEYPGLTWRHILRHNKSLYHNVMPQLYQLNDRGHAFSTAQLKAEDLAAVRGERSIPAGASLLWEVQAAKNPSAFRVVQPVAKRKPRTMPPASAVEEPVAARSKEDALSSPAETLTDMLAFARNEATPTSGMTVAELGQRRPIYRLIFERWMDKLKTPEELRIGNDDPLTSRALNLLVLRGKALSRLATVEMFSDRKDRSETQATFLRRTFKESSPEPGLTGTDLVPLQRFAEIGVLTLDDVNRHQAADREWMPMKTPKSLEAAVPSVRLLSPLVDRPRLQQPA